MICQFCGKQVDDNVGICKFCGSKLVPNTRIDKTAKSVQSYSRQINSEVDYSSAGSDSDMTIAMPKVKETSTPKGFEGSRAVRETENNRYDLSEGARQGYKTAPKRVNNQKRQYYRYNPDEKQVQYRGKKNNRVTDRKKAPKYNSYGNQEKNFKKRGSLLKWVIKAVLLAVVGIIIGILIYLGTTNATNWFNSIGDRDGSSSSVSAPASDKKSNSNNENTSLEKNNTETSSDNTKNNNNSTSDKKSESSESSGSDKKSNSTDSSSNTKNNSGVKNEDNSNNESYEGESERTEKSSEKNTSENTDKVSESGDSDRENESSSEANSGEELED